MIISSVCTYKVGVSESENAILSSGFNSFNLFNEYILIPSINLLSFVLFHPFQLSNSEGL